MLGVRLIGWNLGIYDVRVSEYRVVARPLFFRLGFFSGSDLIPIFFSKGIIEIGEKEDDDARAAVIVVI